MELALNVWCFSPNGLVRITHIQPNGFLECENSNAKSFTFYRTSLTPMPTIPSKFREHQFRQVAEHLGAALTAYPSAVRVNPRPLAVETMARKLREAIVAKNTYGWKHPSIVDAQWGERIAEIKVSIETAGTILLGPLDAVKKQQVTATTSGSSLVKNETTLPIIRLTNPSGSELESVCLLLHGRKLTPTPILEVIDLNVKLIESLESRYDIAIIPLEDKPNTFHITS